MKMVEHEKTGTSVGDAEKNAVLAKLSTDRGISIDVLDAAGLGRESEGIYKDWWSIPYPHRTGLWKTRYRNPDPKGQPKYRDAPGAKFHLYNPLLLGPGEEEIWFAEGEFDTLALIAQGLNAIGFHGVSNVPEEEVDEDEGKFKPRKSWMVLFEHTMCITMFDNDDAGRRSGRRLARILKGDAFDEWNDKFGDVNEWHAADPAGLGASIARFRYGLRRSKGLATW